MQTIDGRIRNIFSDAEKEAAVFINDLVHEINITLNLNFHLLVLFNLIHFLGYQNNYHS